ncbi:ribonuclease H2, subunit C [Trametes elegans]|nr:ribonuclease H2, subunit C [Trametes elegans]
MSAAFTTLRVNSVKDKLSNTTPHLMPFHIGYSGPAPVSTYFRVRSAPEPTYGRDTGAHPLEAVVPESPDSVESSQATLVDSVAPTPASSSTGNNNSASTLPSHEPEDYSLNHRSKHRHFFASFRGRSMHGLEVDLPAGYAGVVLRAPDDRNGKRAAPTSSAADDSKTRTRTQAKAGERATRRSKRGEPVEVADEETGDAEAVAMEDEGPVRMLQPAAQFSSFVLWHPDIPVDESRDEYLRSLTEWTKLAAEIHRVEE